MLFEECAAICASKCTKVRQVATQSDRHRLFTSRSLAEKASGVGGRRTISSHSASLSLSDFSIAPVLRKKVDPGSRGRGFPVLLTHLCSFLQNLKNGRSCILFARSGIEFKYFIRIEGGSEISRIEPEVQSKSSKVDSEV